MQRDIQSYIPRSAAFLYRTTGSLEKHELRATATTRNLFSVFLGLESKIGTKALRSRFAIDQCSSLKSKIKAATASALLAALTVIAAQACPVVNKSYPYTGPTVPISD
jgi:hypothetical protein